MQEVGDEREGKRGKKGKTRRERELEREASNVLDCV
jgi:hypothetical protein